MRIGIAGPVQCREFSPYLEGGDTLPPGLGGTAVTALVHGLIRSGNEVSVYTLDPSVGEPVHARGPQLSLYVGSYRSRARDRALDLFRSERRSIAQFIDDDGADVVNAHWTYEFALGALSVRPDTIVTVRDWAPLILSMRPDAYRLVRLLMDRRCLRLAEYASCASPYMQALLAEYGKDAALTPNMVSRAAFSSPVKSAPAARRIICVSTGYGGRKNVGTLLHAMTQLPDCELALVGDDLGPGGEAERMAVVLGVRDRVSCLGRLDYDAALDAIRCAEVMVHPSLEESFGNVLVEAMAMGIPVVGGAVSGAVPWVLDDGEAGVLVDVRDPSAISVAVNGILGDTQLWHHYSQAGRARVEAHFSESAVLERYFTVYREVLGR